MAKIRSPNYPNFGLEDAINYTHSVYAADQNYIIEREAAVKHMGYAGLSGASLKTLGSIIQYGLLEKVEKGKVRVSDLAVDILHPMSEAQKVRALREAANNPSIFAEIAKTFPGKPPSEESMQAWLIRKEFSSKALSPLYTAYIKTLDYLRRAVAPDIQNIDFNIEKRNEDDSIDSEFGEESSPKESILTEFNSQNSPTPSADNARRNVAAQDVGRMDGEYEWIRNPLGKNSSIRILAKGEIGQKEIEKLIKILNAQKEVLED
jgi:hypothetical protein